MNNDEYDALARYGYEAYHAVVGVLGEDADEGTILEIGAALANLTDIPAAVIHGWEDAHCGH